jgi:hypothetical protein
MTYDTSLVMICPAANLVTVGAAIAPLGYSAAEFSVPLSPSGSEPATHYGLCAWAQAPVAAAWMIAADLPPLTNDQLAWLRSTLIISARTDGLPSDHFADVLAANGLQRIAPLSP